MSAQKGKKTKEDFTSFLLDDDSSSPDKTMLLPEKDDKTRSHLKNIPKDIPAFDAKKADKKEKSFQELESEALDATIKRTEDQVIVKEEKEEKTTTHKTDSQVNKSEPKPAPALEKKERVLHQQPTKKNISEMLDPSMISVEAALKQSEYLRLAQDRIKLLETKLDEATSENDTLASSAHVLQKKYDEMLSKYDQLVQQMKSEKESFKDDLILKEKIIKELEKEKTVLQKKNEEFQAIMNEKIQQVRVRERELMNRLEILQLEEDAVISNKDEILLDLKKQIDRLNYELESYKAQGRQMNQEIQVQKEQMRKTVKALKLALNILEHEEALEEIKKTGS